MGYCKGALELVGHKVEPKKLKGMSKGDKEVHYHFIITK